MYGLPWMLWLCMSLVFLFEACISFLVMNLTKPLLSRMAPEMRGQAGGNPPPPPEPSMEQLVRLMLEDREAA
jgi:hypothetical protein